MPLVEQHVDIPLVGGIDTKSDSKLFPPMQFSDVRNADFSTTGAVKKRRGFLARAVTMADGSTITPTVPQALWTRDDRLFALSNQNLYRYVDAASGWARAGNAVAGAIANYDPLVSASEPVGAAETGDSDAFDTAYCGGYLCVIALQKGGNNAEIFILEASTRQLVARAARANVVFASPACGRVVVIGTKFYCVFTDGSGNLIFRVFDTANLAAGFVSHAITTVCSTSNLALDVATDGVNIFAAWCNASPVLEVATIAPSTLTLITTITVGIVPDRAIALHMIGTSNLIVATGNTTNGLKVTSIDQALTTVGTTTVLDALATDVRAICMGDFTVPSTGVCVWYHYLPTGLTDDRDHKVKRRACTTTAGTLSHTLFTLNGFQITHKLVVDPTGNNELIGVCRPSDLEGTFLTVQNTLLAGGVSAIAFSGAAARYLPSAAGTPGALRYSPCSVAYDGSTYYWAGAAKYNVVDFNGAYVFGLSVSLQSFQFGQPVRSENSYGISHLGGSVPLSTDGEITLCTGWDYPPEQPVLAQTTGGSLTALGTYQVVAVYEANDGRGNLIRSAPSLPATITLTGSNNAVSVSVRTFLRFPGYVYTGGDRIVLYSTTAGGTIFYLSASITALCNATDGLTASGTIAIADSLLPSSLPLYTQGGALDNRPPPPCNAIVRHQDRFLAINRDDGNVWHTKELLDGEGPGWNPALIISLGVNDNGRPLCVASIENAIVLFWKKRIGVVYGDGPDDEGNGSTYTLPKLCSTKVGCSQFGSIVRTPAGLLFADDTLGFWSYQLDAEPQYIGAPVESFNGQSVLSAVCLEDRNEVRWTLSGGKQICYHYLLGRWSTFDILESTDGLTTAHVRAAVSWRGKYTCFTGNGDALFVEDASASRDGAIYFPLFVETGWVPLDGVNGLQRVYEIHLLGEKIDPHGLTVVMFYDYDDSVSAPFDSYTWDTDTQASPYQLVIKCRRQRMRAFKLVIFDAANASSGTGGAGYKGPLLNQMRVYYGVLKNALARARYGGA